jgi:hypothetical protein
MKRSTQVAAPLLAAAALALTTGCRRPEMQRCVDEHNQVVDDSLCANPPPQNNQNRNLGGPGYIPYISPYRYYYGGFGGFNLGTPVGGGTFIPSPNASYTTRSGATTRGGFGSSFSNGGAHGSSGGGEGAGA